MTSAVDCVATAPTRSEPSQLWIPRRSSEIGPRPLAPLSSHLSPQSSRSIVSVAPSILFVHCATCLATFNTTPGPRILKVALATGREWVLIHDQLARNHSFTLDNRLDRFRSSAIGKVAVVIAVIAICVIPGVIVALTGVGTPNRQQVTISLNQQQSGISSSTANHQTGQTLSQRSGTSGVYYEIVYQGTASVSLKYNTVEIIGVTPVSESGTWDWNLVFYYSGGSSAGMDVNQSSEGFSGSETYAGSGPCFSSSSWLGYVFSIPFVSNSSSPTQLVGSVSPVAGPYGPPSDIENVSCNESYGGMVGYYWASGGNGNNSASYAAFNVYSFYLAAGVKSFDRRYVSATLFGFPETQSWRGTVNITSIACNDIPIALRNC